jgi:hypothetical protein
MKLVSFAVLPALVATPCISLVADASIGDPIEGAALRVEAAEPLSFDHDRETEVMFDNATHASEIAVRGQFNPNAKEAVQLRAFAKIAGGKMDWIAVPIEQQARDGRQAFTINFRGSDLKPPSGFKGTVVVHITSNTDGSYENMYKTHKN